MRIATEQPEAVSIFADAGQVAGMGHLARCSALAASLKGLGYEVDFVIRTDGPAFQWGDYLEFPARILEGKWEALLSAEFDQVCLNKTAVVVDSYQYGITEMRPIREAGVTLVVIDDVADRKLSADVVVNGSAGAQRLSYSSDTVALLGRKYALLRSQFETVPPKRQFREVNRVLVSLGASDLAQHAASLCTEVRQTIPGAEIGVLSGPYLAMGEIEKLEKAGMKVHRGWDCVSELMRWADLAISAAGQTAYELAATATPTICFIAADNQRPGAEWLSAETGFWLAGELHSPNFGSVLKQRLQAALDPGERARVSAQARTAIDGQGAKRAANEIARILRQKQRMSATVQ